jgi:hypothetical protein
MMYFRSSLLGLLVLILLSAPTQTTAQQLAQQGIYQSQKIGIFNDLRCYLRFYENGTVIRLFADLNKETAKQVEARLNLANSLSTSSAISKTTYQRSGNQITMTFSPNSTSPETYTLYLNGKGMSGKYKTAILGRDEKYSFFPKLIDPNVLFSNQNQNNSSNSGSNNGLDFSRPPTFGTNTNSSGRPKIYAVVVGVASYNHINSLRYTDDDAFRLYAFLKSPEGGALPDEQVEVLIDEAATRSNILAALRRQFLKAGPNDLVLFYFSGHGAPGAFAPHDYDGSPGRLLDHPSVRRIFDQSRAKHKVCIADACHSGSLNKGVKSNLSSVFENYYAALSQSTGGLALMMSSKAEETSLEFRGLRQGIFTHYLLEGLKGKADRDANKLITINELYTYVRNQVRTYTSNKQSPVINGSYDPNMPLGIVR